MKKFNKVLALGMAGSMALSMAACGGSSSSASTGTDGSSTSTAAPTAAPSKDVVTLKWVAVGSGMPSNYDAWLAQINPYLEDKIGVNIDMEVISWGDWDTRRNVIVNTSGEYDILFTNVNTYNNDVNTGPVMRKSLQAALVTRTLTWHGGGLLHRPGKKCAAVLQLC